MTKLAVFLCASIVCCLGCDGGGGGGGVDAPLAVDGPPMIDGGGGAIDAATGPDAAFSMTGTPGDTCTDTNIVPIQIPAGIPYADIAQTTCNDVTRYPMTCMGNFWSAGADVIYQLDVTVASNVEIQLLPNDTRYAGLALDSACPFSEAFDSCIAMSLANDSNAPLTLGCQSLTVGTYYVMVSVFPSPDCIADFDLIVTPC